LLAGVPDLLSPATFSISFFVVLVVHCPCELLPVGNGRLIDAMPRESAQSAHSTYPHQRPVLCLPAGHGEQDFSATLAFLLRSDVPDHLIYAHRVSGLIEPPNGDAFFACFHTPINASG
jgi:hypothetical protein